MINQLGPKLPINASGSGIGTSPDDRQVFPQVIDGRKGAGASDAWEAGTTSIGARLTFLCRRSESPISPLMPFRSCPQQTSAPWSCGAVHSSHPSSEQAHWRQVLTPTDGAPRQGSTALAEPTRPRRLSGTGASCAGSLRRRSRTHLLRFAAPPLCRAWRATRRTAADTAPNRPASRQRRLSPGVCAASPRGTSAPP